MAALPLRDRAGNALVGFRCVAEGEVTGLARRVPVPASVVVVSCADAVLVVFDSRRRQWELPGGMREPGETVRQAAVRELYEETGIHVTDLAFAAVAEFALTEPVRLELLAVFWVQLPVAPPLSTNDEVLDFSWWSPAEPVSADMSPLDAEIARRVLSSAA